MNLRTDKGEIALPDNFKFDITTNHPFFSDDGSASAPTTIPASPQNREILDYPENPNRRTRFGRSLDGSIQHGLFFKPCKVIVTGASRKGGISTSITLRESSMYAEIQDYRLQDLFTNFNIGRSGPTPWYFYTTNVSNMAAGYFTFFPVATDFTEENGTQSVNIINKPTSDKEFVYAARTVKHGGENISVPAGYGLAPFFYLKWVIELAFQYCGFEVEENVFATDTNLKNIVVLHRYADLLVPSSGTFGTTGWNVNGEHMVPNITMGELITFIHDKFGAFVTVRGRKVSIRLFRDIVNANYDADLSKSVIGEISLSYPEPTGLTMTQGDGIDSGSPAGASMEDLRAGYPSLASCNKLSDIQGSGLFYVASLGKYYHKKPGADPVLVGAESMAFKRTIDEINQETEVGPDDVFVPMIYVKSADLYMPYVGEASHQTIEIEEKEATDAPIMLCHARYYSDSSTSNELHCQGQTNTFHYVNMSQSYTGLIPLTPEGIVPVFWSEYWKLLANGAPELSCELHLSLEQLETMDLYTVKLLNGCRVLMKSIKYSISGHGISTCEATFQLLPEYENGLTIPTVSFSSKIKWKRVSTRTIFPYGDTKNGITILSSDGLTDYTDADKPDYTPFRVGVKAKLRKRWLTYKKYLTKRWVDIFTPYLHSEWSGTDNYEEYFISYLEE